MRPVKQPEGVHRVVKDIKLELQPYQETIFHSEAKYIGLVGGTGVGKCLKDNSRVQLANGKDKLIGEIKRGDEVYCIDDDSLKRKIGVVKNLIDPGVLETYRVSLKNGYSVSVSDSHPFLLARGDKYEWVKVGDMRVGDYTATLKGMSGNKSYDPKKMRLVGYLLADDFKDCIEAEFPECIIKSVSDDELSYSVAKNPDQRTNNALGLKSVDKEIPPFVFTLNNESIAHLLKAMFSCDGCVEERSISYSSASEKLIDGVQSLLMRFGIISVKRSKHRYELKIESGDCIKIFREQIGLSYQVRDYPNIGEEFDDKNLPNSVNSDVEFLEVSEIEYEGANQCYDLEIEGYHNFVANGIVVHNTWLIPRWLYFKMCVKPGEKWIVSSISRNMLFRNPIAYIERYFKEEKIEYTLNQQKMVMQIHGLGEVHFISAETSDEMMGVHAKGIIGDEAGLFPRIWWDTAIQRVGFTGGQILLTTTPYSFNWLKTEFYDQYRAGNKDFFMETPTSQQNKYYPIEEINRAYRRLPDWKFKLLYLAKFTRPQGLIYENFAIHKDFEIPSGWRRVIGMDFGWNHPCGIVWIAIDPDTDKKYVYKEFKKREMEPNKIAKEIAGETCAIYGDPGAKGELESLKTLGFNMLVARKEVEAGISHVIGLFKTQKLSVAESCVNLIDELNSYSWASDKEGNLIDKPVKLNDDLVDPLRYSLFTDYIETDVVEFARIC